MSLSSGSAASSDHDLSIESQSQVTHVHAGQHDHAGQHGPTRRSSVPSMILKTQSSILSQRSASIDEGAPKNRMFVPNRKKPSIIPETDVFEES